MTRRALLVAVGALALGVAPIAAQTPGRITFDDAVRIALERNAGLRAAQNGAEVDQLAARGRALDFLPDLSFSSRQTTRWGRNFNDVEGRILNDRSSSVNLGLASSVTLFDGFANVAALRQARYASEASQSGVERERQAVVFDVVSNYVGLIEAHERLGVQRENLAAQEEQLHQIQERLDAGTVPVSDLYQQQASVAGAKVDVVGAERDFELARIALVRTLFLDPTGDYEFELPALPDSLAAAPDTTAAGLVETAFARRADVDAARAQVEAASQGVRVAGASRWPSLNLSASYASNYVDTANGGFSDQLDLNRTGSVGLALSFPLFDRLDARLATARATLEVDDARLQAETLRQDVAEEVQTALLDLRTAVRRLDAAEAQAKAAERALEAVRDRYEFGAGTLLELTQARAVQVQAESELVSARANLLLQREALRFATGEIDPERFTSPFEG